ncbi:hypothetical protein ACOLNO_002956 [Vibrio parahaemolyticus]
MKKVNVNEPEYKTISFFAPIFTTVYETPCNYNSLLEFKNEIKQLENLKLSIRKALIETGKDLNVFIDKSCQRQMGGEIQTRLIKLGNSVIECLYLESEQQKKFKFSFVDGVGGNRNLTKQELKNADQILYRIKSKPHVYELFLECVEILDELILFRHKIKRRKLKGKKPK